MEWDPDKKRYICLFLALLYCITYLFCAFYVGTQEIVFTDDSGSAALDYNDMTEEVGNKIVSANRIHFILAEVFSQIYGCCQYDYATDTIMIGLTDCSEQNIEQVQLYLDSQQVTEQDSIVFFECDYTNQALARCVEAVNRNMVWLKLLGVKSCILPMGENQIRVTVTSKYSVIAMFAVSRLVEEKGMISFGQDKMYRADGEV